MSEHLDIPGLKLGASSQCPIKINKRCIQANTLNYISKSVFKQSFGLLIRTIKSSPNLNADWNLNQISFEYQILNFIIPNPRESYGNCLVSVQGRRYRSVLRFTVSLNKIRIFGEGICSTSKLSKMANQNAESQPGPSSRSEFIPWKLLPVDLERSSGKESNVHTVSPSQMPKPTPSVPCSIPRSLIEVELSDKSFTMIKSALSKIHQDMNKTSIATDASNEPISSSPIPEPTLSMNSSSSVQNAASNQSKGSSKHSQNVSKIGPDDEPKFIALLRKHSHLYDTKDPSYRDQKKKKESWIAVGKILDRTDDDCQTKWKSLREKYIREMKQISADENRVSKTKQFIKNMSFIPYKKRTRTKRRNSSENCGELPESSSRKRKKGDSASKSVLGPTSSTSLQRSKKISKTNSRSDVQPPVQDEIRTRNENAEADEAFVKTVELELQQYSPKLKTLLKAKIFQVFTEVRNRI